MITIRTFFCFLLLQAAVLVALAQDSSVQEIYHQHLEQAERYSKVRLYLKSEEELNSAIEIAKANDMQRESMEAVVLLAELYRKTEDRKRGIELLNALNGTEAYPDLHVRMLGRLAALKMEVGIDDPEEDKIRVAEVLEILDEALTIAIEQKMLRQEASIKNELGYIMRFHGVKEEAREYLIESAHIYERLEARDQLIRPLINLVNIYQDMGVYQKADSIADILFSMIDGKDLFGDERDLYDALSYRGTLENDSILQMRMKVKALTSEVQHLRQIHNSELNAYRVLNETEAFQRQAEVSQRLADETAEELEAETARNQELAIYLSILLVLVIGVVALLLHERKLKANLKHANKKYLGLLVESNHRVKNNLQMIASMVRYTKTGLDEPNDRAFDQLSTKIQTISALHAHLFGEHHKETVELGVYFKDIVQLHQMQSTGLEIKTEFAQVEIDSERLVYFGLILNEMLSNTAEHRGPSETPIEIRVQQVGNGFQFSYCDGANIPSDNKQGNGTKLIQQLATRVKGTGFTIEPSIGQYTFSFDA